MPFNGSGGFVSIGAPDFPAVDGTTILASQYNNQLNDIFNGLGNAVTRDGQSPATANLPMGGFKHTNVASASGSGQYIAWGQNATLGDLTIGALTATGVLAAPAGAVGAPGFTFSGDTNNGWWAPGTDVQAWSLAGAEVMRLNGTGLGLGVTPLSPLHVKSGSATTVRVESTTARGLGQVAMAIYDPTGIKGYFGYGSANDNLHVYQGLGADLLFYTTALERMRVDASGNVGIGAVPLNLFHLNAASGSTILRFSDSSPRVLGFLGSGSGIIATSAAADLGLRAEANLVFASGGNNERLRIDSSGRMGLGVTPQAWGANRVVVELGGASDQSYVAGRNTVNVLSNLYFDGTNFRTVAAAVGGLYQVGAATHNWFTASNGGAGGISALTQTMWLDSSGSLGIGVSPTSILDISRAGASLQARVRAAAGFAAALQLAGNNNTVGSTSFDLQQDSAGNADIVQRNNARLSLYANNTEWLRLNAVGTFDLLQGAGALRVGSHVTRFESAEQTCPTTNLTAVALTHGGSRAPDQTRIYLRCKTAELGYSIGDEYCVTDMDPGLNDRFFSHWANATTVNYWWVMGTNSPPAIRQKGTATLTTVTAANWRVVVRCLWL